MNTKRAGTQVNAEASSFRGDRERVALRTQDRSKMLRLHWARGLKPVDKVTLEYRPRNVYNRILVEHQ